MPDILFLCSFMLVMLVIDILSLPLRPATQLIGPSATVAVRFCPVLFKRRRPNSGYVEGYLFCQGLLQ